MQAVSDFSAWCEHVGRVRPQLQNPPLRQNADACHSSQACPSLHQGVGAGGASDRGS